MVQSEHRTRGCLPEVWARRSIRGPFARETMQELDRERYALAMSSPLCAGIATPRHERCSCRYLTNEEQ